MKKMIAIVLALMLCVSALSVVAFAADDTFTVHVKMPEGFGTPNIWAWGATNSMPAGAAWPGVAMTAAGEWYTYEAPVGTTGLVINTAGDADKTADITIDGTADVWVVLTSDNGKLAQEAIYNEDPAAGGEPAPDPDPAPAPEAYYVAGTGALCNGKEWVVDAAENKMTKGDDGIWTITYTAVPAGEHKLKVTGGNWNACWGAINGGDADGNIVFTLEEATDVIVKYNPANQKVTVLVNGKDMNPSTGDMGLAGVSVALLAATAGLVAIVSKKKEF